jgi:hypothetical protein
MADLFLVDVMCDLLRHYDLQDAGDLNEAAGKLQSLAYTLKLRATVVSKAGSVQ